MQFEHADTLFDWLSCMSKRIICFQVLLFFQKIQVVHVQSSDELNIEEDDIRSGERKEDLKRTVSREFS